MGTIIFIVIAVVFAVPILDIALGLWPITIPLVGAYFAGLPGFLFGIGLDVVIALLPLWLEGGSEEKVKSASKDDSPAQSPTVNVQIKASFNGTILQIEYTNGATRSLRLEELTTEILKGLGKDLDALSNTEFDQLFRCLYELRSRTGSD
jgi:hypothetical protein